MQAQPLKLAKHATLGILLAFISSCSPQPTLISQITPVPSGVSITSVTEANTVTSEITQHKSFNQCDSASPFKAQIQFGDTSGQTSQQELVIKGTISGEAGLSEIAKLTLEGAIEQHFASSSSRSQGHQEGVAIEVPPHIQQEYTIVWRDTRREGTVEYKENGEAKTVNYSYRIGLELVSATGKDVLCPGQPAKAAPTQGNIAITSPTYTPEPQVPSTSTSVPPTTSPTQILASGNTAYGDGLTLKANFFCVLDCGFEYDYTPAQMAIDFVLRNTSGQSFILPSIPSDGLYIKLDTGERLYIWSNIRWAEKKERIDQQPLGLGAEIRWRWVFRLSDNRGGGVGQLLPVPNTSRSFVMVFPEIWPRFPGAQWQGKIPR